MFENRKPKPGKSSNTRKNTASNTSPILGITPDLSNLNVDTGLNEDGKALQEMLFAKSMFPDFSNLNVDTGLEEDSRLLQLMQSENPLMLDENADIRKDEYNKIKFNKFPDLSKPITLGVMAGNILAGFNQEQRNDQKMLERMYNVFKQKPIYDINNMYGSNTNQGSEYQPIITAEHGAKVRKNVNAPLMHEVEGGEVIQLPNMDMERVEGKSHAQGGVKTLLPDEARVYSDKLKMPGTNKTFAQLAKKYDISKLKEKAENPTGNKIDRSTAQMMMLRNQKKLDEIFAVQQSLNGDSNGELKLEDGGKVKDYLTKNRRLEFISRMEGGNKLKLANSDGSVSTHKMMSMDNKVFPSIVNRNGKLVELSPEEAFHYAMANNEFIETDNERDAQEVATTYKKYFPAFKMDKGAEATTQIPPNGKITDLLKWLKPGYDYKSKGYGEGEEGYNVLLNLIQSYNNFAKESKDPKLTLLPDQFKNTSDVISNYQKQFANDPVLKKAVINYMRNPEIDLTRKGTKAYKGRDYSSLTDDELLTAFQDDKWHGRGVKVNYQDMTQEEYDAFVKANKAITDEKDPYQMYFKGFEGSTGSYIIPRVKASTVPTEPPANVATPPVSGGYTFGSANPAKVGSYKQAPFPMEQSISDIYGFVNAMNTYPYWTPDFTHWETSPATLNIQPQIQAMQSGLKGVMRQNSGSPAMQNARNTGAYISYLEGLQGAYSSKQNYDAESRAKADMVNMESRTREQNMDVETAHKIYNDYRAVAKDNAATERHAALTNLFDKVSKHKQQESLKSLYSQIYNRSFDVNSDGTFTPVGNANFVSPANAAIPVEDKDKEKTTKKNKG